ALAKGLLSNVQKLPLSANTAGWDAPKARTPANAARHGWRATLFHRHDRDSSSVSSSLRSPLPSRRGAPLFRPYECQSPERQIAGPDSALPISLLSMD